jgi:hypothetical protein
MPEAEKTGQVLVRTLPTPRPAGTPMISGEEVGYVRRSELRWRIERDFQDLKQEIGLDHYEGRGWRGFHHHAALSIAAYGFLIAERSPIPPRRSSSARSSEESRYKRRAFVRAAPLRPERHTPNSISTIRRLIATALPTVCHDALVV